MQTKNKVAKHLRGGDQLVLRSEASGKQYAHPVIGVDAYENEVNMNSAYRSCGPWVVVQTTYEVSEADGNGGQKLTSKKAGILFRADENVQVVVDDQHTN